MGEWNGPVASKQALSAFLPFVDKSPTSCCQFCTIPRLRYSIKSFYRVLIIIQLAEVNVFSSCLVSLDILTFSNTHSCKGLLALTYSENPRTKHGNCLVMASMAHFNCRGDLY